MRRGEGSKALTKLGTVTPVKARSGDDAEPISPFRFAPYSPFLEDPCDDAFEGRF